MGTRYVLVVLEKEKKTLASAGIRTPDSLAVCTDTTSTELSSAVPIAKKPAEKMYKEFWLENLKE